jgi:hypothetical protein
MFIGPRNAPAYAVDPPLLATTINTAPTALNNAQWIKTNITAVTEGHTYFASGKSGSLIVPNSTGGVGHVIFDSALTVTNVPHIVRGRFKNSGYSFAAIALASTSGFAAYSIFGIDLRDGALISRTELTYSARNVRVLGIGPQEWLLEWETNALTANSTHLLQVSVGADPTFANFAGDATRGLIATGIELAVL